MRKKFLLLTSLFLTCASLSLDAGIIIKGGKIYDSDDVATGTLEEHYKLAQEAYSQQDWKEAAKQYNILAINFLPCDMTKDAYFYSGVSYFNMEEYEFGNLQFTNYIKSQNNPKYYEEAIRYKYMIAEAFRNGAKRHIMGYKMLPSWLSASEMSLPCHDLAAQALFSKACLHWSEDDYREAVDTFQTLIKRFPKNELAPESYLSINRVYLEQSQREFQNPDILELAQLNARKFARDFPGEERLQEANADVLAIKEVYATGLYETGQFYERKGKPQASILYYKKAIEKFPDTEISEKCKQRYYALTGKIAPKDDDNNNTADLKNHDT
jgi:outer membrane protein assembly factor BamD (BamD/ComL family)